MGILAIWKSSGIVPPVDMNTALDLAEKSAAKGNPFGIYALARIKEKNKDGDYNELFQKTIEPLCNIAKSGDSIAESCLASAYENGHGVLKDQSEAFRWRKMSAEHGSAISQSILGSWYQGGNNVAKDLTEAVKWYKLSAQQGCPYGLANLAICYHSGSGIEKNPSEAARLYRLAADQGLDRAQYNLGVQYENGEGVPKDLTEAVRLYKLAADQGDPDAKNALNKDSICAFLNKQKTELFIKETASRISDPESCKYGGPDTFTAVKLGLSNESLNSSEKQAGISVGMLMMKMSGLEIKTIRRGRTLECLGYTQIPKGTVMYPIRFIMTSPTGMEQSVDIYCFKDEFGDWSSIPKEN